MQGKCTIRVISSGQTESERLRTNMNSLARPCAVSWAAGEECGQLWKGARLLGAARGSTLAMPSSKFILARRLGFKCGLSRLQLG